MSSVLNIAAVSETLRKWLHEKLIAQDDSFSAQLGRPDQLTDDASVVNIFLFETTRNTGYSQIDLPTRSSGGGLTSKPVTAVDLHYLVSFSSKSDQQSQIMMALVVRAVHAHGGLSREKLESVIPEEGAGDNAALAKATVHEQNECIRLNLRQIGVDEMSKLWGMFPNKPYVLSIGVTATTVILEADHRPESVLPVQEFDVIAVPRTEPRIDSVSAVDRRPRIVYAGDKLIVLGNQITGEGVELKTDNDNTLSPEANDASPTGFVWTLPENEPAGFRSLIAKKPRKDRSGRKITSSAFPFVLRPQLPGSSVSVEENKLIMSVVPKVQAGQKAVVILNKSVDSSSYLTLEPKVEDDKLTADLMGVAAAKYLIRVRVDGAESLIQGDFVLRPQLPGGSLSVVGKKLIIGVIPKVQAGQKAEVVLNKPDDPSSDLTLEPKVEGNNLTADLTGVAAGKYVVRVRVDGAESLVTSDDADAIEQEVEVKA